MKLHHEKIPSDFSIAVRWTGILATLLAILVGLAEIAVRIN